MSMATLAEFAAEPASDVCVYGSAVAVKDLDFATVAGSRLGRLGGYVVRFTDPDVQGDVFTPKTWFGYNARLPLLWHHGFDEALGNEPIGWVRLKADSVGLYVAEGGVDLDSIAGRKVWERLKRGESLGFSSGSVDRMVFPRQKRGGGVRTIERWPLTEVSITPVPVEPRNRVEPLKSLEPAPLSPAEHYRREKALKYADRARLQRIAEFRREMEQDGYDTSSPQRSRKAMRLTLDIDALPDDPETIKGWRYDFRNLGEFLRELRTGTARMEAFQDVCKSTPLGMQVSNDAYSAVIPPGLVEPLWRQVMSRVNLPIAHVKERFTQTFEASWPAVVEDSQATGSRRGGVQAYMVTEGSGLTTSSPKFRSVRSQLKKLVVTIPVTEELIEDSPEASNDIENLAIEEMAFILSDQIVRGSGVGEPVGVIGAPGTVTVAIPGGQTADLASANIAALYGALTAEARTRAAWFVHPELEQLFLESASAWLDYTSGGPSNFTCLGRPVYPCDVCSAPGEPGDIIIGDFSAYGLALRSGVVRRQLSMDVYFDSGQGVFKFAVRYDGKPMVSKPRTPYQGSQEQSPFAVLASRA